MNEKYSCGPTTFTPRRSTFRHSALRRGAAALLLTGAALCPAYAGQEESEPRVSGRVTGQEKPVSLAQVYAYDVATYALEKVLTDQKGQFLFDTLPAGLYKIVAHKQGFVPAVQMLLRRSPEARQFVELELVAEETGEMRTAETYWETRSRIPADVLQQIRQVGLRSELSEAGLLMAQADSFAARMAAQGGVAQGEGYGSAQLTETSVGVEGSLGQTHVSLDGRYLELSQSGEETALAQDAEVRSMELSFERPAQGRVDVATSSSDAIEVRGEDAVDVDVRFHRVGWSGNIAGGTSEVSAQVFEESNYYNSGIEGGPELPESSRTLSVEGAYSRELTPKTSLTAGMSFRQREGFSLLDPEGRLKDEAVDVYGVAGSQIQPRILVEYGLYSTVRGEGSLSLMPFSSMVVKLGSDWEARTSVAQRVESSEPAIPGFERFNAAFYSDQATCHQVGEACYEVTFERSENESDKLSVGAIHREFAETLRLYFSEDFFNRLESLFVVPGDQLPELQFRMVRQISPKILAKLESNIAKGGGGIFYATEDRAYENQVRYLVTSLDTRFQRTSTGVFLAFHHLEQALNPISSASEVQEVNLSELEIQRLQLMLTQDLSALANLAPSLAVRFNMELSRGATPYQLTDDDELHKKLTGGISVSF